MPAPFYSVWIAGTPKAHQRPTFQQGRFVHRQDRGDLQWRRCVRAGWLAQAGNVALSGPVRLHVVFVGGRGDLVNRAKAIEDALGRRGFVDGLAPAYEDDRQVVEYGTLLALAGVKTADHGVWIGVEPLNGKDHG